MEINIKESKNIIEKIIKGSIADEINLEAGDEILFVNGKKPEDIIDYKYLITDEYVILDIKKRTGERISYEIEKDFDDDLGIEFTNPLIDRAKSCSNNCIFCFINQLPEGMRETLYFKDDDSRLSFLQGNFITLTNLREDEIERIIKYRISPINISVHTTNRDLRIKMLKNRFAGDSLKILDRFNAAGIKMNIQIVSVPGINDGLELEKTIRDLYKLGENIKSVAVVPVGLTKYRENLPVLEGYDREKSIEMVEQVEKLQDEFLKESGTRFVFLSDEFYCLSGIDIPEDEEYEGYPQIENGVGLIRNFYEEFKFSLKKRDVSLKRGSVSLVTGALAYDFMCKVRDEAKKKLPNMDIEVKRIENDFFGHTITVAGLVTGGDIINQMAGDKNSNIVIPDCMLREDTDYFLDDVKIKDIEKELDKRVFVAEVNGEDFLRVLFEEVE